MSGQIGIPKYKDLVNKKIIDMKNNIELLSLRYKMLASQKSVDNRESEVFEQYCNQYREDMQNIDFIRQYAQNIVKACDEMNLIISKRAIQYHVYEFDNDEIEEMENDTEN